MGLGSKFARVVLLALIAFVAEAQERHYRALVIGNGSYTEKPLRWPGANARSVALRLKELGYEVTALENTTSRQLSRALTTLRESIGAGDVVLFYYAGRATRARATSSLVPIDNSGLGGAGSTRDMPLLTVLDMLEFSRAAANVVVLDVLAEWPLFGTEISKEWLAAIPPSTGRKVIVSGTGPGSGSVTAKLLRALESPTHSVADLSPELGGPRISLKGSPIPRAPASRTANPKVGNAAGASDGPQTTQAQPTQTPPIQTQPIQPPPTHAPPVPIATIEAPTLTRFPTMDAPARAATGVPFSVLVSLTMDKRTPEVAVAQVGPGVERTSEGALNINLPCQTKCELEVVLAAPGFDFTSGSNTATIEMSADGDSTPARFNLRALQAGEAKLEASFWYKGAFLARAVRAIQVSSLAGASAAMAARGPMATAPVPAPAMAAAARSILPLRAAPPDLTVRWEESTVGTQQYCIVIVTSPHLGAVRSAPCVPGGDLGKFLAERYQQLHQLGARGVQVADGAAQPAALAADQARGLGRELYDHFATKPFQDAFWALVDKEKADPGFHFRSIQIYTNNPVLPWEILVPARPDGSDARGFLGLEFDIARWHIGERVGDLAPLLLRLDQIVALAPHYQGASFLAHQREELDAMHSLRGYRESGGSAQALLKLLDDPPAGIIHFAGHGFARAGAGGVSDYGLQMEDASLSPTIWRGHQGKAGTNHPLVILNACETGGEQSVSGFVDGWAAALLETGACGFIGGLWPLGDKGAAEFTKEFYAALKRAQEEGQPATVADLVRRARSQFTKTGDPTFLAYVFYGDARLRIE